MAGPCDGCGATAMHVYVRPVQVSEETLDACTDCRPLHDGEEVPA